MAPVLAGAFFWVPANLFMASSLRRNHFICTINGNLGFLRNCINITLRHAILLSYYRWKGYETPDEKTTKPLLLSYIGKNINCSEPFG